MLLDTAGYVRAGRMLVEEARSTTTGAPGTSSGIVSRAQPAIKTATTNSRITLDWAFTHADAVLGITIRIDSLNNLFYENKHEK